MAGLNFPEFSSQGCAVALEISSDLGFCEISVSDLAAIISSSPLGCGKMEGLGHADLRPLLKPSGSVNTAKGRECLLEMYFLSLVFALNAVNAVFDKTVFPVSVSRA